MKITERKLKNGLKLLHVKKEDTPANTLLFVVGVGSKYEEKRVAGISHFLEHIFFKGTKKRGTSKAISEYLEEVGGVFNAFTGKEVTGFYAEVTPNHLERAFDFISDLLLNPLFPDEEIKKEKGVIIEEMNMVQDIPMRYVEDQFEKLLYGETPAGRLIVGTKESVLGVQRDDFLKYVEEHYLVGNGVLVYVGGEKISEILNLAEKYFASFPKGKKKDKEKVVESQSKPGVLLLEKKTDQTHLCLGFRGVSFKSEDRYPLALLAGILGGGMSSRLFTKVRDDLGLCYYIRAMAENYTDTGYLLVQAGVDNTKVAKAVSAILAQIKALKEKGPSSKELKKIKEYFKGHLVLALETTQEQAHYFAEQYILEKKIETIEDKIRKINRVKLTDLNRVAKKYLINSKLNLAVIGPFADKKKFEKILTI